MTATDVVPLAGVPAVLVAELRQANAVAQQQLSDGQPAEFELGRLDGLATAAALTAGLPRDRVLTVIYDWHRAETIGRPAPATVRPRVVELDVAQIAAGDVIRRAGSWAHVRHVSDVDQVGRREITTTGPFLGPLELFIEQTVTARLTADDPRGG